MALKTDYKNAIFSGNRRYHITENEDGTVSLTDVTQYIQKGDKFGARDVNGIGDAINGLADSLSDAFSETKGYNVGEYVIYDNKIYRFTAAKAAGPWEADKVEFAKVAKVVGEIYGNITSLQTKMQSFESTKGEIANSALGKALGMLASHTWAQIVAAIKAVANRGTLNWSGSNTTYSVPAGYYAGGTLDSRPSYNAGVAVGKANAINNVDIQHLYDSRSDWLSYDQVFTIPTGKTMAIAVVTSLSSGGAVITPSVVSGGSADVLYNQDMETSHTHVVVLRIKNLGSKLTLNVGRDANGTAKVTTVLFTF